MEGVIRPTPEAEGFKQKQVTGQPMRRLLRVVLAVGIILLGQWLAASPEIYEPIFGKIQQTVVVSEDSPIVNMQDEERWLVLVVEFPDHAAGPGRDVDRASVMLTGEISAKTYFDEISAHRSTLIADVYPEVYKASYASESYGMDSDGRRDAGTSASGGPAGLAEEAMIAVFSGGDISEYDLDGDGWIDRLLIIHTGDAQEDGGGTDAIWSHYGPLNTPFAVAGVEVGHYTMASFDSGLGTIIHEMLHMTGAVDLYDVHSAAPTSEWNGLGDWDIMASGNWNGNGRIPALPTSPTLELIGALEPVNLSVGSSGPENQTYVILPHVSTSGTVRIQIAPGEYVWLELRVDSGFDKEIPGHGLLVSQQNINVGDISDNEVNRDPDYAWTKIIEADGDGGLTRGVDEGSSGDVFQAGQKFGSDGIQIRDSRGRLVNWLIEVNSVNSSSASIKISSPGVGDAAVLPPPGPLRLLEDESIPLQFTARETCMPWSQVNSTDGRIISLQSAHELVPGDVAVFDLSFVESAIAGTAGEISGTVGCGQSTAADVVIPWAVVENRLIPGHFEDKVPVSEPSSVVIPLEFEGDGWREYDVIIEGPLARIASTDARQNLGPGSSIVIEIDPEGLLSPGMIARGSIQLYDEDGLAGEQDVSLQAEPPDGAAAWILWLTEPANNIQLISLLLSLWVLMGIRRKKPPKDAMRIRQAAQQGPSNRGPDTSFDIGIALSNRDATAPINRVGGGVTSSDDDLPRFKDLI